MADPRKPHESGPRRASARSAGARGDKSDLGGIPSTAESALSPGSSSASDPTREDRIDRDRPVSPDDRGAPAQHGDREPPAKQRDARRPQGKADDDSPLESIGKAVSAPVRGAADEDADEKPR